MPGARLLRGLMSPRRLPRKTPVRIRSAAKRPRASEVQPARGSEEGGPRAHARPSTLPAAEHPVGSSLVRESGMRATPPAAVVLGGRLERATHVPNESKTDSATAFARRDLLLDHRHFVVAVEPQDRPGRLVRLLFDSREQCPLVHLLR